MKAALAIMIGTALLTTTPMSGVGETNEASRSVAHIPQTMLAMDVLEIANNRAEEQGVKIKAGVRMEIGYGWTTGVWKVTYLVGTNLPQRGDLTILVEDKTKTITSVVWKKKRVDRDREPHC